MSRDTQALAKLTADQLLKEGIKPTQQNVRERMGTGSITTINKALNAWWTELGERFSLAQSQPNIPEPIAESANNLWKQALAYAAKELEDKRAALEKEFSERYAEISQNTKHEDQELKELRSQCLRLLQNNEALNNEKATALSSLAECENKLMAAQVDNQRLERELKQVEAISGTTRDIDNFIELQVENRVLKEENKRLLKQIDSLSNEKAALDLQLTTINRVNLER